MTLVDTVFALSTCPSSPPKRGNQVSKESCCPCFDICLWRIGVSLDDLLLLLTRNAGTVCSSTLDVHGFKPVLCMTNCFVCPLATSPHFQRGNHVLKQNRCSCFETCFAVKKCILVDLPIIITRGVGTSCSSIFAAHVLKLVCLVKGCFPCRPTTPPHPTRGNHLSKQHCCSGFETCFVGDKVLPLSTCPASSPGTRVPLVQTHLLSMF